MSTKQQINESELVEDIQQNGEPNLSENEETPSQQESTDNDKEEVNTENETKQTEDKINELNDKYLRLHAEFDNYRRRTNKEKIELIDQANEKLLIDLLPTIDDFERAIKNNKEVEDIEVIKDGFVLIYKKLVATLETQGLKAMSAQNEIFNSDLHDAIAKISVPDEQKGKVIEDVEKGYWLNEKVIRFAKVVVGN